MKSHLNKFSSIYFGKLNRRQFLSNFFLLPFSSAVLFFVYAEALASAATLQNSNSATELKDISTAIFLLASLALLMLWLWYQPSLFIRRTRDLGVSAWSNLFLFVPYANLCYLLYLFIAKGKAVNIPYIQELGSPDDNVQPQPVNSDKPNKITENVQGITPSNAQAVQTASTPPATTQGIQRKKNPFSGVGFYGILLVVGIVGSVWQGVAPQVQMLLFPPSTDIVNLASQASMTQKARELFYLTNPQIETGRQFRTDCKVFASNYYEFGCYSGNHITLLSITNSDLAAEETVTASHEMLHAAYAHMSDSERTRVNSLLEKQYQQIVDPELSQLMDHYAQVEPGQRDNELHSILGTEQKSLSAELEQYYSQYFTNRSNVVADNESFKLALGGAEDQLKNSEQQLLSDLAQMNQIMSQIKSNRNELSYISDYYQYNSLVYETNALIDRYNSVESNYNANANDYNSVLSYLKDVDASLYNQADYTQTAPLSQ